VKAFLVLLAVAAGVLAVLLVGSLSRTTTPAGSTAAVPADTAPASPLASVDPTSWARWRRRANGICDDGKARVQRHLNHIRLATVPEQVLISIDRIVRIQRTTATRLGRLEAPIGLGPLIQRLLAVIRAQHAADRERVAALRARRFTPRDVTTALRRDERRIARVTSLSTQLGVTSCSRYVDYDFYE
jgi:hypothetical protein